MAAKVALVAGGRISDGNIISQIVTVTGDNPYPAGGYTLTATQLGLGTILGMSQIAVNTAAAGVSAIWNSQSGKLQLFVSGSEVTGDLTTFVITMRAMGY